ncbi:hypothetical protein FQN52_002770 [Onygenales sp. PD_12]|nr:hypothetical protein FQN52_002770 [Onygenales sp. PD_12]
MAGQKKKAITLETPKGVKAKVQQQQPMPESSQCQQKRYSEEDENEHEEDDLFVDNNQEMVDINDEGTGETTNNEDTQSGDEDDHSNSGISLQQDEDNALDFKPEQFIHFDDDFSSLEDLSCEVKVMQLAQKQDLACVYDEHYKAMNKWCNSVQIWEIEVLQNEWQKNNKDIFPPEITQDDVNKAIDQLQHDIKDERLKKPRTIWIGCPETTIISAECKLLSE